MSAGAASRSPRFALPLLLAAALASMSVACGLRTPVRPVEDTAPVIPGEVTVSHDKDGAAVVHWKRADKSADGQNLDDLVSFVVEKKSGDGAWQRVATVDVVDQEKIRRRHDFSWKDESPGGGETAYRVSAVCADGQEGPSRMAVTAVAPATAAAPAVTAAPAATAAPTTPH